MAETRTTARSVEVDGRSRTWNDARPVGVAVPAPLILAFHGSNQNGRVFRRFSGGGFDELAASEGLIVAYLDGYDKHWNDARVSTDFAARTEGYDDVAFAEAVVREYVAAGEVDAARVYGVGYSNGAQLVIRLVHERPELFAAALIIGATQPVPENFAADDRHGAVPIMIIHGTKDPIVPYAGGVASLWGLNPRGMGLSHPETAAYFAARNGITGEPSRVELAPSGAGSNSDSTTATQVDYREAGHPPVRAITIERGGHTVPHPTHSAPPVVGRTHHGFSAADAFWRFATTLDE